MNPGKLNKKIIFFKVVSFRNEFGGALASTVEVLTTFGSLEPMRLGLSTQMTNEAAATVLNDMKILIIYYRSSFTPEKDMIFVDAEFPDEKYTIGSITPYWPGTKLGFQSKDDSVFQNKRWVYIVGTKRD